MINAVRRPLFIAAILASSALAAAAQEPPADAPAAAPVEPETPAMNEDEMADYLNSKQQITQGVTLTRTINGEIVETRKETVVYTSKDPHRSSEAGLSPLERLKAEFDSQALTRSEAVDEAKLDFIVADLDRDNLLSAAEFVFLVKGWEEAEISGSGSSRFVDPYFHVDEEAARAEHAEQARAKFASMAGEAATLTRKAFTRRIIEEFERRDLNKDEILTGDELLNFRAAVRGEAIDPQ